MTQHTTPIPTRWIGPIHIHGNTVNEAVQVPLATYETPALAIYRPWGKNLSPL
nr:hypothetical protein [Rappaport israeli]